MGKLTRHTNFLIMGHDGESNLVLFVAIIIIIIIIVNHTE